MDDLVGGGASRYEVRLKLDEVFHRPLDEVEAEEYDRDNWGLSPEAILAAESKDALWGDMSY